MFKRALILFLIGAPLGAQRYEPVASVRAAVDCPYAQCALGISPSWNGLDVVRGERGERVATLGFFIPGDISGEFSGQDSATAYAIRAMQVRRAGAVLTDAGIAVLGLVAVRQVASGDGIGAHRNMALAGAGALAVSVPLQFAADGLLSRAVWWYDRRFARQQ